MAKLKLRDLWRDDRRYTDRLFSRWLCDLDVLDAAIAEALYGKEICVYDDAFSRQKLLSFGNGKVIAIPEDELLAGRESVVDFIVDQVERNIGSVRGCRRMLDSFADCEVNQTCALGTAAEDEEGS